MNKNMIKILLDLLMLAILVIIFNRHAFGQAFHEIIGLFLWGLFVIHLALNWKVFAYITVRFFSPSMEAGVRFRYVIQCLLLVSFVLIVISGIFTSQVLFTYFEQARNSPWRTVHHFCAALSVILAGVHLGLHWSFVTGMFKKVIRIPRMAAVPLGTVLLLVILVFGACSMANSRLTDWLAEPFRAVNGNAAHGKIAQPAFSRGNEGQGRHNFGQHAGEKQNKAVSPRVVAGMAASNLSMIGVFTIVTCFVDNLLRKKNKRPGG